MMQVFERGEIVLVPSGTWVWAQRGGRHHGWTTGKERLIEAQQVLWVGEDLLLEWLDEREGPLCCEMCKAQGSTPLEQLAAVRLKPRKALGS